MTQTPDITKAIEEQLVTQGWLKIVAIESVDRYRLETTEQGEIVRSILNGYSTHRQIDDALSKLAKEKFLSNLHDRSQSPVANKEQLL